MMLKYSNTTQSNEQFNTSSMFHKNGNDNPQFHTHKFQEVLSSQRNFEKKSCKTHTIKNKLAKNLNRHLLSVEAHEKKLRVSHQRSPNQNHSGTPLLPLPGQTFLKAAKW